MSEVEVGKAPTNNLVVFGFCELWGILLGLPPGEDLYHGQAVTARMLTFLIIGSSFAILGPAWPWVKNRFPRRLSATFVRAATDFRWWMIVVLVGFVVPTLLNHRSSSQEVMAIPRQIIDHTPAPSLSRDQVMEHEFDLKLSGISLAEFLHKIAKPCQYKVTAPLNQYRMLRNNIVNIFHNTNAQCDLIDDARDSNPEPYIDPRFASPTPALPLGVIVHASPNSDNAKNILIVLSNMGLNIRENFAPVPNLPSDIIWIEIGASPWG
jgi:hypothetical protein